MKHGSVEEVDHRERCADPQSEYSDCTETEPGGTPQNTRTVAEVLAKLFDQQHESTHVPNYYAQFDLINGINVVMEGSRNEEK